MPCLRDLAQPGRALALGARCRRFESYSPDHKKKPLFMSGFFYGMRLETSRKEVRLQAKGGRKNTGQLKADERQCD